MNNQLIKNTFGINIEEFEELYSISDSDYSKVPTPILVQPEILKELLNKIPNYNNEYNDDYGFSTSSFLSLMQKKT